MVPLARRDLMPFPARIAFVCVAAPRAPTSDGQCSAAIKRERFPGTAPVLSHMPTVRWQACTRRLGAPTPPTFSLAGG